MIQEFPSVWTRTTESASGMPSRYSLFGAEVIHVFWFSPFFEITGFDDGSVTFRVTGNTLEAVGSSSDPLGRVRAISTFSPEVS